MKKGDRVMVIAENAKRYGMKGIIDEIKGNEALIKFPDIKSRIMYYTWNLHLEEEAVTKESEKVELYLITSSDQTDEGAKIYIRKKLSDAIRLLDALSNENPTMKFYIFKAIGEAKAHQITTVNRFLY